MTAFKPMLAASKFDASKLRFPLTVQAKLDGIRATVVNGKLISRNGKPIPNAHVRACLERREFEGLDGELISGDPRADDVFRVTTSAIMREDGEPQFTFFVFDCWNIQNTYVERHRAIERATNEGWTSPDRPQPVCLVPYVTVHNTEQLDKAEAVMLEQGYEGAILRVPDARYKFGRGTMTKLDCVKLKRFIDFEAVVIGYAEEQHNGNEATTNAYGRTERSTAKAGKTGKGRLGKLICRREDGVEFGVGTGFDANDRAELWAVRDTLPGRIAKIKSFPIGAKDAPRFPVWLGFRHEGDMPATTEV
jgi:DNA ligase-1